MQFDTLTAALVSVRPTPQPGKSAPSPDPSVSFAQVHALGDPVTDRTSTRLQEPVQSDVPPESGSADVDAKDEVEADEAATDGSDIDGYDRRAADADGNDAIRGGTDLLSNPDDSNDVDGLRSNVASTTPYTVDVDAQTEIEAESREPKHQDLEPEAERTTQTLDADPDLAKSNDSIERGTSWGRVEFGRQHGEPFDMQSAATNSGATSGRAHIQSEPLALWTHDRMPGSEPTPKPDGPRFAIRETLVGAPESSDPGVDRTTRASQQPLHASSMAEIEATNGTHQGAPANSFVHLIDIDAGNQHSTSPRNRIESAGPSDNFQTSQGRSGVRDFAELAWVQNVPRAASGIRMTDEGVDGAQSPLENQAASRQNPLGASTRDAARFDRVEPVQTSPHGEMSQRDNASTQAARGSWSASGMNPSSNERLSPAPHGDARIGVPFATPARADGLGSASGRPEMPTIPLAALSADLLKPSSETAWPPQGTGKMTSSHGGSEAQVKRQDTSQALGEVVSNRNSLSAIDLKMRSELAAETSSASAEPRVGTTRGTQSPSNPEVQTQLQLHSTDPKARADVPQSARAAERLRRPANPVVETVGLTLTDQGAASRPASDTGWAAFGMDIPASQNRDLTATPNMTQAQSAALARDVAQQLAPAVRTTPGEVTELMLRPEELGQVKMRLTSNDGQILLQVMAERPETQEIMRRHIDMVERAFRELGYSDIAFEFSSSGEGDHSFTPQGQAGQDPTEDENPANLTDADTPQPISVNGTDRLDIRV